MPRTKGEGGAGAGGAWNKTIKSWQHCFRNKNILTGGAGVDTQIKQPCTKFKGMKQAKNAIAVTDFMFKFTVQLPNEIVMIY